MAYLREWGARDRGLAEALIEHEDSLGPHGIPWSRALDPDSDGWFEVVEVTDHAQAALDRWHKANPKPGPGVRVRVVDARDVDHASGEESPPDGATVAVVRHEVS